MLSKPIYELAPYVYLMLSSVSIVTIEGILAIFSGTLLYGLGTLVWMMRFQTRYPAAKNFTRKGQLWPTSLYELYPFLVLASAVYLLAFYITAWSITMASALISYSFYILAKRYQRRAHICP